MRSHARIDERCLGCILHGAIEGLEDGLVLVDPRGRVVHVNRRAREIVGLASRDAAGATIRRVLIDPALAAFWASAVRSNGPASADLRLANGSGCAVRATLARCVDGRGRPIGRMLLLRDVTDESRIRVELSAAVARRLVEMTGAPDSDAPAAPVTLRERQVLGLLAAGMSNAAIARHLGISAHTVASHLKHAYAKIGAGNRAQAVAFALTHGMRPPALRRADPGGRTPPPNG